MIFHVFMHYEEDTDLYVIECPALPGCLSQGKTEKEALDNIKEAITGWLMSEDEDAAQKVRQSGNGLKEIALAL